MLPLLNLKQAIGGASPVDPDDARSLNETLERLGLRNVSKGASPEIVDVHTRRGVRSLQTREGLRVDGVLRPGGPTERIMNALLLDRGGAKDDGSLSDMFLEGSVGRNGTNRPKDVARIRSALVGTGFLESGQGGRDTAEPDLRLAIQRFQKDFNLGRDATIEPDDRSSRTLERILRVDSVKDVERITSNTLSAPATSRDHSELADSRDSRREDGEAGGFETRNPPLVNKGSDRIRAITENRPARFRIVDDSRESGETAPWHARHTVGREAVTHHEGLIASEARKQAVDPDLVRAIVYVENAHGWYDSVTGVVRPPETVRPMNINPDIWSKLGIDRATADEPTTNVRAGVKLIKRLVERVENPTPRKIAALWNSIAVERTGNGNVEDFAARVHYVYQNRLWENETSAERSPLRDTNIAP